MRGGRFDRRIKDSCGRVAAGVATFLALGLVTAPGAIARTPNDPCGSDPAAHVTASGLHCGKVWEVPGHRTVEATKAETAASCDRDTEELVGINNWIGAHGADWDYWTRDGAWVLWNGFGKYAVGKHDQPIDIKPQFHNWGSNPWPVRIFFRCAKRY